MNLVGSVEVLWKKKKWFIPYLLAITGFATLSYVNIHYNRIFSTHYDQIVNMLTYIMTRLLAYLVTRNSAYILTAYVSM